MHFIKKTIYFFNSGFKKRKVEEVLQLDGETEQLTFGLSESILMDFVETVVEADIPDWMLDSLSQFFLGKALDKKVVTEIIHLMKTTFVRFFGKTMYFRSLTEEDQMLLTMKNLNLLVHFCLAQYETASTGFDQFSWLLATNTPPISKKI